MKPISREACTAILNLVATEPGLGIRQVSERLGFTSPTDRQYTAQVMRVLEAMGLLVSTPVEERHANSEARVLWYAGMVTALDGPQLDRGQTLLLLGALEAGLGVPGQLGSLHRALLEHLRRECSRLGWR